ncbi:DUF554 domain-containing protein [Kurthia sibirica]|uniref:DUF554 domain-containing protein n=1 Tax=Kurthia sibirica TaxID=202750 RepID=A0A2U3AMJ4_9BACL|nr:DUF554 domain-containing protein [Kurthia sibirica]PWI25731.1 DUF554 domain-containing protein [Kurthia sibirica]GEK35081.1 membrane protein [Kurthia sibirica]
MILLGSLINGILIVIGSLMGYFLKNIPERMKTMILQIIGLAIALMGIQMGLKSDSFIVIIISLVIGTVIGEWLDLDKGLYKLGKWIEKWFSKGESHGQISEGFVSATLIFAIGSMAILGALDSGIRQDHSLLITKGLIDGFTAIILTSTLGIGVLLSAVPVFLYQGIIAICAGLISTLIPAVAMESFIVQMTATGGVMILALGLNMVGLTKIRVANTLPAIVVVGIIVTIQYNF